jgi:hypothetical protein
MGVLGSLSSCDSSDIRLPPGSDLDLDLINSDAILRRIPPTLTPSRMIATYVSEFKESLRRCNASTSDRRNSNLFKSSAAILATPTVLRGCSRRKPETIDSND